MWKRLHEKYSLFLLNFNKTSIFSKDFQKKKLQIQNSIKILSVEAELFHVSGQTDEHEEANILFSKLI